ncbi:MAG: YcgJ family protein [Rhodobacteraceae bacterium]|jgi:hypothetical protein|nr:YcgJ family protein [Paracoccaceae bacterium]
MASIPRLALAAALAASLGLAAAPAPARADSDDAARAFAAALLALGMGIAIGKHGRHDHVNQWDVDMYGEPFSPSPGIICLPRPRKCYGHGNISHRWTARIFG